MIALARAIRRRSAVELSMLVAALGVRASMLALLRIVSVARLQRWGTSAARVWPRRRADAALDRAVAWAVATAAVILPVRNSCLADALTAHWLLAACGRRSTIRFGVSRSTPDALRAHAWLEADGEIIVGARGVESFALLE
jgi:transglutaminase superfamily protein